MFQIDVKNRKAIYEQIVDNFKELIITGVLKPDEKMPSVRDMAKTLIINPNTMQKAYRELEKQGYIYTVSGLGCFIAAPKYDRIDQKKIDLLKGDLRNILGELIYLKCSKEEIEAIIHDCYSLHEDKEENQL